MIIIHIIKYDTNTNVYELSNGLGPAMMMMMIDWIDIYDDDDILKSIKYY